MTDSNEAAAVWTDIGSIHEWEDNPRDNTEAIGPVADSIKRFGFAAPIICRSNGEIIAGHTRYLAAKKLGLNRVPVRFMDLDPADAKLLALADNRLSEIASWDYEALGDIMNSIENQQDIALTGFTEAELNFIGLIQDEESEEHEEASEEIKENEKSHIKIEIEFADKSQAIEVITEALKDSNIEAKIV